MTLSLALAIFAVWFFFVVGIWANIPGKYYVGRLLVASLWPFILMAVIAHYINDRSK